MRAFCRDEGLRESAFYFWRRGTGAKAAAGRCPWAAAEAIPPCVRVALTPARRRRRPRFCRCRL